MTRVTYIKSQKITKKETGEPFYFIQLIVGEEVVKTFITEEVFKKINEKKPVYKKEYNAEFEIIAKFEKLTVTLKDLHEIK